MARRRRRERHQPQARGAVEPAEWIVVFLEEPDGSVPARSFLDECPTAVRAQLLATISAVRAAPPPSFPTSALWHVMRDEMRGLHEARDKHEKRLYRLFCVLDRHAPDHGLDGPAVVLISGGVKAIGEAMDARVYREARRRRDEYLASTPRRILRDE